MPISVLIADAQRLLCEALAMALSTCPEFRIFSDHPKTAVQAIQAATTYEPDVMLLDYWLGDIEGAAVISTIHAQTPEVKILTLSWFHGPPQIQESLAAGAVGFLPKGLGVREVVEAIQRACRGESPVYGEDLDNLIMKIEGRERRLEVAEDQFASLTPRELEVLQLIAQGFSIERIVKKLRIGETTVRSHIHQILSKMNARSQLEAVAIARGWGLLA